MQIDSNKAYYATLLQQMQKQPAKSDVQLEEQPQSQAEKMRDKLKESEAQFQSQLQQLEQAGEQSKAANDKLKVQLTCLLISGRIISGDNVPAADHNYLVKHDAALYAKSILMRIPRNNPYKYKRASPYEKEEAAAFKLGAAQPVDKAAQQASSTQELLARMLDTMV